MKKLLNVALLAIAAMGITSCDNHESLYDPTSNMTEYDKSFVETFGAIPEGQSWDFYAQLVKSLNTRAIDDVVVDNTIGQPSGLDFTKWQTMLKSGYDNSNVGVHDYSLLSPGNGQFKVYAVWYAGWYPYYKKFGFELGIVVDGEKVKLFNGAMKDEPIQNDATGSAYNINPGFGADVYIPSGTPFTFYMSYNLYGTPKTIYSNSGSSTLLYSNLVAAGKQLMVLGFEDSDQAIWPKTRPDFNDVVLYIEGNPELPVAQSKRFMCEDLGMTGDFDFNDVVFDVMPSGEANKLNVILQAAGGTLPAVLTVAGQEIGEVHELFGVKPGTMVNTGNGATTRPAVNFTVDVPDGFELTDFTDFKVTVTYKDGTKRDITYKEDGTAPATLITPISTRWMKETINIKEGYPNFFAPGWCNTANPDYLY